MILEGLVVRHCSPTLAGLKSANLLCTGYASREEVARDVDVLNERIKSKGLNIMVLGHCSDRTLVYVYRSKRLKTDLENELAASILLESGYDLSENDLCLEQLKMRIQRGSTFPHEIGLFLGYPPEDVMGFIVNGPAACKMVGAWKVYGDTNEALRIFKKFKKCTEVYMQQWSLGRSIERLSVAV